MMGLCYANTSRSSSCRRHASSCTPKMAADVPRDGLYMAPGQQKNSHGGRGSLPPSPAKQAKWLNASVSFGLTVVGVPDHIDTHSNVEVGAAPTHQPTARHTQSHHGHGHGHGHRKPTQLPKMICSQPDNRPHIRSKRVTSEGPPTCRAQITPSIGESGQCMTDGSTAQQPGRTPAVKATKPTNKQGPQGAAVQRAAGCNKAYRSRRAHTQ